MKLCSYLPERPLYDIKNVEEALKEEFQKFMENFVIDTKLYLGKPIRWNNPVDNKDYGSLLEPYRGYAFCHIVSKEIEGDCHHRRELELKRLECLNYLYFFIECMCLGGKKCNTCANFLMWNETPYKKPVRHYFYCKNAKFLIILQEHQLEFVVVSAFPVDANYHNGLMKRYEREK